MDVRGVLELIVDAGDRRACSDAERRAACAVRDELRAAGRPQARLQTLWLRPGWAGAQALLAALIVGGSVASVWLPAVGLGVLAAAALALAGELTGLWRPARLLAAQHATQNVVAEEPAPGERVHLVLTANVDAGTCGAFAALRRPAAPSPIALVWASAALLCVVAGLRLDGRGGTALAAFQVLLTLPAAAALGLLLDIAADYVSPGANVNASGVAAVLALSAELAQEPPAALCVDVVVSGAGDRQALGLQRYLRSRRGVLRRDNTVVLAIEPCGGGEPMWLERDGALLPVRMHPRLCELAAAAATGGARAARGGGMSAAYVAQLRRIPAIAIGALDEHGRPPRAHQLADTLDALDLDTLERTVALARGFVRALDAELQGRADRV